MNTVELTIYVEESLQEYLIAELSDLDFDAFLQEDHLLKAYVPAPRWNDVSREHVEQWLAARGVAAPLLEAVVPEQNWNRQWEETIEPLAVGPFIIKPTWAERPAGTEALTLLEIDPKMSFGTGYHESTRLALRLLPGLVAGGERVLDAGTGTGILAIAALKLGAASAVAFDIDAWASQNAVENFLLNGVADRVTFVEGTVDVVDAAGFELIFANINLNVLLDALPAFAQRSRGGTRLLLSGLLSTDRDRMVAVASEHGFALDRDAAENEWWAGVFEYRSAGAAPQAGDAPGEGGA